MSNNKNFGKFWKMETAFNNGQNEIVAMCDTNKMKSAPPIANQSNVKANGFMTAFCNDALSVLVGKARDHSTRTVEIVLVVVYQDLHVCPPQYYKKSQLGSKLIRDLYNLDGITVEDANKVCMFIKKNIDKFPTITLSNGKAPIQKAYHALIDYAKTYEVENEVYIKDGYVNIKTTLLKEIINRLGIGYTRLELKKALLAVGLLRSNADSTGHFYDYKIGPDWFLSLKIR